MSYIIVISKSYAYDYCLSPTCVCVCGCVCLSLISSLANSFIRNWYDNSLGYAACAAWGKVVELWPTLLGSVGKCVYSSGARQHKRTAK